MSTQYKFKPLVTITAYELATLLGELFKPIDEQTYNLLSPELQLHYAEEETPREPTRNKQLDADMQR